jgi:hypothetical protein
MSESGRYMETKHLTGIVYVAENLRFTYEFVATATAMTLYIYIYIYIHLWV